MGHARALINVDTIDKQLYIYKEIKDKGLSVRQTEELVRNLYKQSGAVKKTSKSSLAPAYQKIEDNLASYFSTRVKLKHSRNGNGQIIIDYYSQEELTKILEQMDVQVG
jgi:ParB family chromosome partitioning protein